MALLLTALPTAAATPAGRLGAGSLGNPGAFVPVPAPCSRLGRSAGPPSVAPGAPTAGPGGPVPASPGGPFLVTFQENGLPTGTYWSVTYADARDSATSRIDFPGLPNGTLPFTLGYEPGYLAYPASGCLTVDGGPVVLNVTFVPGPSAGGSSGSGPLSAPGPGSGAFPVLPVALVLAPAVAGVGVWARLRSPRRPASPPGSEARSRPA